MKWGEAALKIMAIKNMITNMMPIKKSNKSICAGDVFVLNIKDCGYILGLVIKANIDFPNAPMPGSNLIYIYNQFVPDFNFSGPIPSPDKLLIPPVWINKMPWTKGLFANIGKSDLTVDKVLKQHCFYSVARRTFVNENGNVIPKRVDPCGEWALNSYRSIDDLISDALGIQRAPDSY